MQEYIRNFAIIAHIDHGKSTLSDRLLELTHTITKEKIHAQEQYLDQNPISRERGITIKLAPVRMHYAYEGKEYLLNLIDTPGHVDFSYEVSRTLAACEGVVLLVDATKGVQAQTVAHLQAARKENIVIIPIINKIDMPNAEPEKVALSLETLFGFKREDMLFISARTGEHVEEVLKAIITRIPSPQGNKENSLRALIFDALYDEHKGVIAHVCVKDGRVRVGENIQLFQSKTRTNATGLGYFTPHPVAKDILETGDIGYIVTGIKDIRLCRVGDTITTQGAVITPLPGYIAPQPMVFFGVYPESADEFSVLREGLQKYALTDASISFTEDYSPFLGSGFRVGFLGLLHAEIFKERLQNEFHITPFLTLPHVIYETKEDGTYKEPYMHLTIYTPQEYIGSVMGICQKRKGELVNMQYQEMNTLLEYDMPYSMFLRGFASELKTVSAGFASIDYALSDYRDADLVSLEIRINDTLVDVLTEFVYRDEAPYKAREKVEKLKEFLPRQQIKQVIQCMGDGRILAREDIAAFRKDVLAKMSGGDRTRKDKLLQKQKKGKKKLLSIAKITIPSDALFAMLKN